MPAEVVRALSEGRIAYATLVLAMLQACLVAVPDVADRRYPHLQRIAYGTSPSAEHTLRRAVEVFQCDFVQAYGMTETTLERLGTAIRRPQCRILLQTKTLPWNVLPISWLTNVLALTHNRLAAQQHLIGAATHPHALVHVVVDVHQMGAGGDLELAVAGQRSPDHHRCQ